MALPYKIRKGYKDMSRKEKSSPENMLAGVKWRLQLFDDADADKDGRLNKEEFKNFYKAMEAKLTEMVGGAYHLTDEDLENSHAAHDLDGNGHVTKDEVLWSRKIKLMFYMTMKLTKEMVAIFKEDLELFYDLPAEVQNKMILRKIEKGFSLKGADTISPIFEAADKDGDGKLNRAEWQEFSMKLADTMAEKYG